MKNAICVKCGSDNRVYRNSETKELLCTSCAHLYKKHGVVDLSKKRIVSHAGSKTKLNKSECCICHSREYVSYSGKYGNYLCGSHLAQFRRCGKIINKEITNNRIWLNVYNILSEYVELIITRKDSNETYTVKIDKEDMQKVSAVKWSIQKGCNYSGKGIYIYSPKVKLMHRYLTGCAKGLVVDHINHDHLDNRKSNLRICTNQQNCMNSSLHSINTSGCSGIGWVKDMNKWWARIGVNGERIVLGYFTEKQDAIDARKTAEEKYYGVFRNISN